MRHLKRYRQIADAMARHGLGYLVGVFGLTRLVPFHKGILGHPRKEEPYTQPEHVRLALEELGTTFMKLGQILSTRPDLLGPDFIAELSRLQDSAPTVPFETIAETIEAELGRPVGEIFASLESVPLASASIGQAHAGVMKDGADVVVKVRRPGVVEQVNEDLEILRNVAVSATSRWEAAREYDLIGLAEEFSDTLRRELDYVAEARNAERFATAFADNAEVHIPRILWDATTSRVLTLERIRGLKITDLQALEAAGIERRDVALKSTKVLCRMVFEDGFFHADPHPGNFLIEPDGRLGIIDFGMVGTLDEAMRDRLAVVLMAATTGDGGRLADGLIEIGATRGTVERDALRRDLDQLLARYSGRPIGEVPIGPLLEEVLTVVRRHHLQLPADLALLLKTMIMSEGLGVHLDPQYRLGEVLAPYATGLVKKQYSPENIARRLGRAGTDTVQLATELPGELRRILETIDRHGFEFNVRAESLQPLMRQAQRHTNRLSLTILAGALIIGLALIATVVGPEIPWTRTALRFGGGATGLLVAGLVWSVVRSGKGN